MIPRTATIIQTGTNRRKYLGCKYYLVALAAFANGFAGDARALATGVHIGCIDEVDSCIHRTRNDRYSIAPPGIGLAGGVSTIYWQHHAGYKACVVAGEKRRD